MRRRGEPIRISNRDYCLLDIAYQISVIQKTPGKIEILFIFQIFIEQTSDSRDRGILNNLQSTGLIRPGDSVDFVYVSNMKNIFCERFGEDFSFFNQKAAKSLIQRWEDKQFPLFDGNTVNDDDLVHEEGVHLVKEETSQKKPEKKKLSSRHERDLILFEKLDAPQIMADHLAIQEHLNEETLTSYRSILPFGRHCPSDIDVHTARAVLTRLGYMFRCMPFGTTQNHWGISETGLDLIEEANAEPSAHPSDLLGH